MSVPVSCGGKAGPACQEVLHLTGDSARLMGIFHARTESCSRAESTPACQQAKQTVLPLLIAGISYLADSGMRAFHERTGYRWFVPYGALIALTLWAGLSLVLYRTPTAPTVRVAALHYDASLPWSAVDKFSELTRRAAQDGARIIVWPEIAIEGDPQVTRTAEFRQLAAESNAYLTLGYLVRVTEQVWRNEATMLSPDGQFLGVFGKDYLVVFAGETSPTRGTYPV